MVIAVVVNGAFAVKEESVLALFHGQGAVGAQEEQVAGLGMGVGLYSVLFRAAGGVLDQDSSTDCNQNGTGKKFDTENKRGSRTVS